MVKQQLFKIVLILTCIALAPVQKQLSYGSPRKIKVQSITYRKLISPKITNRKMVNPEILSLIKSNLSKGTRKKIESTSRHFLGKRYSRYSLGEGKKGLYDQKPLYRFDQFDCTTYIETVIAIALAESYYEFIGNIKKIRYHKGKVTFITRNHFTGTDWIPHNKQSHFINDITEKVAGNTFAISQAHISVNKQKWFQTTPIRRIYRLNRLSDKFKILKKLKNQTQNSKKLKSSLPYIDLDEIFHSTTQLNEIISRIPSGSIINVLNSNWTLKLRADSPINIIHQGFAIRQNGRVYFRHASSSRKKAVIDIPLKSYLRKLYYTNVKGINILELQNTNIWMKALS